MKQLIEQYNKGGFTYSELEWELLDLFGVSGSIPPLFRYHDDKGMGNNVLAESKEWCMVLGDDNNTPHVEPKEFIIALVEGGNDS